MAQLVGGSFAAIRMDQLKASDLLEGDAAIDTDITKMFERGGGRLLTLRGLLFVYDDFGRIGGGTLFALNLSAGGETIYDVTGLNVRMMQFAKLLREKGDVAAFDFAFSGDDSMRGSSLDDVLIGYGGADDLAGGVGADTLIGGAGNDHLYGHSALGGVDGNDSISGDDGVDYIQGNVGNDTLDGGTGNDRVEGGEGNDLVRGGAGNDSLGGNLGNDTLDGGDGNDTLRGGQGNDSITGGAGIDMLSGDMGVDTLRGGAGADRFLFTAGAARLVDGGLDVIVDFENGSDRISLDFQVISVLGGGREGNFAGAASSAQQLLDRHGGNAEVAAISVGSDTYLFFAGDGGDTVDSAIRLMGISPTAIDGRDFV